MRNWGLSIARTAYSKVPEMGGTVVLVSGARLGIRPSGLTRGRRGA